MAEPSLQLGNGNWAGKSDSLLAYHKANNNFYADELTFARASTGTIVNAEGLIEQVPYNLLQQSNTFNTTWTNTNSTKTSGQSGYDGSNDAWLLQSTIASGEAYLRQTFSIIGEKTFSIYAKAGTSNFLGFYINATSGFDPFAYFNLSTGAVGTTSATASASIVSVGSGWYRCSVNYDATITNIDVYVTSANGSFLSTTGDNVYIQDAQLNSGSTAKTYYPTTTRLNVPRIDYLNNANGSLLLESQRTNLLTYSEDFSDSDWTVKANVSISANATTSPDGTTNADKLVEDSSNNQHRVYRASSGAGKVFSFFAKAGERSWVSVLSDADKFTFFNLSNGTIGTIASSSTAKITDYENGWYRCEVYNTHPVNGSLIQLATANNITSYQGDGTSGVYIYGAQLEEGSYATSYIPTSGTTATRNQDTCSTTGLSDVIGQTEGTLFVDVDLNHTSVANNYILQVSESSANRVLLYKDGTNKIGCFALIGSTAIYTQLTSGAFTGINKIAFAYKSGDFAFYVNGTQIGTSTATFSTSATFDRLDIDANNVSENGFFNYNQAQLYKTRLTNTELATLTTI